MNAIALAQTLPVSTLATYEVRNAPGIMTLGEARSIINDAHQAANPWRQTRKLAHCHVAWGLPGQERALLQWLQKDGTISAGLPMTRTALVDILNSDVLPSRGRAFLEELLALPGSSDNHARSLQAIATMATQKFLRARGDKTRQLLVSNKHGEDVITGCVGSSYNDYPHVQLMDDMIDGLPDGATDWQVLSLRLTDNVLRVRFLADDRHIGVGRDHSIVQAEDGKLIPAIELWNSENGHRAVWLKSLGYRALCANGYASLAEQAVHRWNHVGDAERLRQGIAGAVEDIIIQSRGIADAYDQALDIAVDDAWGWMQDELADFTRAEAAAVQDALHHDTTSRDAQGQPRLLASMLDAVTFAAHDIHDRDDGDLIRVEQMERAAARMLRRGQREARDGMLHAPIAD